MVKGMNDPRRVEPGPDLAESPMLEAWLDFHRTTLLVKCDNLAPDQLSARPIASSKLSLHGLIRHMAEVERRWFRRCLLDEPVGPIWRNPSDPERDLFPLGGADWLADLSTWERECERSRVATKSRDLDALSDGEPRKSLRWIMIHMIEEYARHNGHADLVRELLDGAVGW